MSTAAGAGGRRQDARRTAPRSGSGAAAGIARAAGLILIITLVARIAGFVRYLVFGASVGGGDVGTAYASANLLPNVMFEIVAGGALAACVIPLVAGLIENDEDGRGRERASATVSALLTWTLLLTALLGVGIALAAEPLSTLILGSDPADAATAQLGARLLRVFAVQLPLYGIAVVLGAFCQARRRFLWPALGPLLSSLVVMGAYGLYAALSPAVATVSTIPHAAEVVLAWGTTAGVAVMALCPVIPARRAGLSFRPTLRFAPGLGRRALSLGGAGLGAVGAQQIAIGLILLLSARAGGTGTLPVFQYGQAVYLLPYAVLVVPVITSVFPHLSELRLVGDTDGFARAASVSLRAVMAIAALGAAVLFAAAPAIEHFFRLIDRAGVTGVGSTVAALALGLAPYAVVTQVTRILSADLRARDALLVGSIGWGAAAVLIAAVVLSSPQRHTAEASTAFGLCISAGMVLAALVGVSRLADGLTPGADRRALYRSTVVSILAFAAGAVAGYLVCHALLDSGQGVLLSVAIGILGGLVAALVGLIVLAAGDRDALARLRGLRSVAAADALVPDQAATPPVSPTPDAQTADALAAGAEAEASEAAEER